MRVNSLASKTAVVNLEEAIADTQQQLRFTMLGSGCRVEDVTTLLI